MNAWLLGSFVVIYFSHVSTKMQNMLYVPKVKNICIILIIIISYLISHLLNIILALYHILHLTSYICTDMFKMEDIKQFVFFFLQGPVIKVAWALYNIKAKSSLSFMRNVVFVVWYNWSGVLAEIVCVLVF